MNIRAVLIFLLCVLFLIQLAGQDYKRTNIEFISNDTPLKYALAGGLNNPQYSDIDLNNDGKKDLFVFDQKGNVVLTFLNGGTANTIDYTYAPEYIDNFPRMINWALLRDYNCDGVEDIFTYSTVPGIFGVEVYRGFYTDNEIDFEKVLFPGHAFDNLFYPNPINGLNTNIIITGEDVPAIDDLEMDGDLDILTFNPGGGYIEHFENKSADLGYGCDSLIFELVDECWGRFFESGINEFVDLSPQSDSCVNKDDFIGRSGGLHVGSTLLTIDMDADYDKDLILGDLSFHNLNLLINGLNTDTSLMISQDVNFPSNSIPVDLKTFPSAYYVDIDNDVVKDLLVTPNAINISENYFCSWMYKNSGANNNPTFSYQTDVFLVDQMIDFGSEAYPVFFDHNGDGLLDLVVGSGGYFQTGGDFDARLFLFENTGSIDHPAYELVDENYAGLMGLGLRSLHPTFGDVDGDMDKDMIVGEEFGKLFYFENTDNGNGVAVFSTLVPNYQGIDVGQFSTPFLVDLNRDDLIDLVIGEFNGNLNYFQNTGTQSVPAFSSVNNFLGSVDTREPGFPVGYSQPVFLDNNNTWELYTGGEPGNLKFYTGIEGNLITGDFIEADSNFASIFEGQRIRIDLADINNDGELEIAVGNFRGGLAIYSKTDINPVSIGEVVPNKGISIFPNPASHLVNIAFDDRIEVPAIVNFYSITGQLFGSTELNGDSTLSIADLPSGIIIIELRFDDQVLSAKLIKQ